ncbi:hypothetical protein GCM10029992_52530 [Glycomyces albus]
MFRLRLPLKDTVVLLGTEHNKLTYSETDRKLSIRTAYPFFLRMFSPDFYFFAPYDDYKRQRDVVLPRFQGRQLDTYVEVMENEVRSFMDGMGESGELSIPEDFGPLIMRVAARSFLGERFAETTTDWFGEFRRFSEGRTSSRPDGCRSRTFCAAARRASGSAGGSRRSSTCGGRTRATARTSSTTSWRPSTTTASRCPTTSSCT